MPIDPSIILQGQNPSNAFVQQQQALQNQQAAQQERQLRNYQILQAKQDFEDQQNLKEAWRQAQGDPTQTMAIASKLGVSPKMIQAYQTQQLNLQNDLAKLHQTQATTDKTNLDVLNDKHSKYADAMSNASSAAPDQFEAVKNNDINQGLQTGLINADEANHLRTLNQQQWKDQEITYRGLVANSQIVKNNADANKANTDAGVAKEKQANEQAGQIADSRQKALNGAAGQLAGVLQGIDTTKPIPAPTVVSYGKMLDGLDPSVRPLFPSPVQLATMKPNDAARAINMAGMTSEQRQKAAEQDRNETQLEKYQGGMLSQGQQRLGIESRKADAAMLQAQNNSADHEITALTRPHQVLLAGAQGQLEKINDAGQMLQAGIQSGNPEGAALAIPKVLSALVSGNGSGVRITQAELDTLAKARGFTGNMEALAQQFKNGSKLTNDQMSQLQGLLSDVSNRVQQKMSISNDAINKIQNAPDRNSRYAADQEGRDKMNFLDAGGVPKGAEVRQLPNGTHIFSTDGGKTVFDAQTGRRLQ